MEEQGQRNDRLCVNETKEVKRQLTRSRDPLPALEESDVDSDDDNSLSDDPIIELGGEDLVDRDMCQPVN
jgi:hypothetical protein